MHYDKHHLVPFGEFVPPGFRWFIDAMNIPLGDFNRGAARQSLFTVDEQRIAPDICYEDAFGEEIIRSVRESAEYGAGATIRSEEHTSELQSIMRKSYAVLCL